MAPAVEVHHQEGEVVERVDIGEGVVEVDAVEGGGAAPPQHDVPQVQVAMAALCPAPRRQPGVSLGPGLHLGGKRRHRLGAQEIGQLRQFVGLAPGEGG